MWQISGRARLMLDLLFGVGALFALVTALGVGLEMSPPRGLAVGVASVVAIVAWVVWRRQDTASDHAVVALIGAALVVALVGDGAGVLPLLFIGLIVVTAERGTLTGLLAAGAWAVASVLIMTFVYHRPGADIAAQSLGVLLLLGVGLLIAQLVRETDQARRENARLLDELRASVDREKDHVLAEERARAASDLHDGLGHQLTAIRMGLDFADRVHTADPEAAWAEVSRARDLSAVALDRMRMWVRALDPVPVGALTGTAALEAVAETFRGTGLDVTVIASGAEQPLDREQALFCLRVVQEGLPNALRHGGARHVDLVVEHSDGITLTLTDDGTPPEATDDGAPLEDTDEAAAEAGTVSTGYGLRSLSERAGRLGGVLEAGWGERGFRLRAHLPVGAGRAA